MIVFRGLPGRRRRAGDIWTSTLRSGSAAAAEDGSSSGAYALRGPRKATLWAALQALTLSSRGLCDGPASRRTTPLADRTRKAVGYVTLL